MAEKYQKLSHVQHVLQLPDTYIGSVETSEETRWVYDASEGKMAHRKVQFNPGLYKTFDELLVNARDALVRSQQDTNTIPVKHIDISAQLENKALTIRVKNDGNGIPVEEHPTEKCYVPELIFGHLLTSSNYDKNQEKIVGGKNGYGSKCLLHNTNIPLWNGSTKLAKDIVVGDVLIGDDGTMRTVQSVTFGKGQMYTVEQANGDPYTVNDQHILTLYMPDHKVIVWNETKNGWTVLWWNHKEMRINQKTITFQKNEINCEECGQKLSGNLQRHYNRMHKDKEVPVTKRKSPSTTPPNTPEVQKAREQLEEFCKTIPDDATIDISIQDYMKLSESTKKRLAGLRGQCVQWPKHEVALDPYILGLWLGDGMKCGTMFACYGEKDPEIVQAFEEWAEENDATIRKTRDFAYRISSKSQFGKKNSSPLRNLLKKYNLVDNKHIPSEYLVNDRDTRLKVLAGLIDTDGHVFREGTRIEISQGLNHETLTFNIVHLARSLGFCCQLTRKKTSWTVDGEKRTGEAYIMNISGEHVSDIPTRLPRKKCENTVVRKTSTSTGFLTIKDAGIDNYVGISIDGNERFLINDFTVTHNCSNIFAKEFRISVRDPKNAMRYEQVWRNNMSVCEKPSLRKDTAKVGFVEVTYMPDLDRFLHIRDANGDVHRDMLIVLHTRAIELAALVGKDVKVSWNGEEIKTNSFEKFIKLFLRDDSEKLLAYEKCGPRWEVAAVLSRNLFSDDSGTPEDKHISFVNGINTRKGGKHVETVQRHVLADVCEAAKKKKMDIKPGQIKDTVTLFVNATIVNPSFDSQTKETLTTPAAKFGSVLNISPKFTDALVKLGILEEAQAILEAKSARDAKKTDGSKKRTIYGLPKLEDALLAGTARSSECTLILTEGDSAATSAIAGLKVVGRQMWGVFPLKGKLLNVKDIGRDKFNNNEELTAIKKIIGLEQGKKYKDTASLRYGRILVMSDQDVDGFHIRGLLMNLFHTEWPELMHLGFLCTLMTPLVKMTRGNEVLAFYSSAELDAWKERIGEEVASRYKSKYYKGLGTSTPAEAREWFENLSVIRYTWDDTTDVSMNLAFSKKQADERKQWLSTYNPKRSIEPVVDTSGGKSVAYTRFVHDELIHFSNADNLRSLPHILDGLKPSQRKILFGCFKRNLHQEVRVAQLAGYVSEHAAYHHGEASLNQTIVGMAQIFVGANNINLLSPIGQFGSRLMGGKDAASPRYIHTHLEGIVSTIFRKEDAPILENLEDDGDIVEPVSYLPTVPLLAINGCVGIGTGFSTDIPPHNPREVVSLLSQRMDGSRTTLAGETLNPWWIGFRGAVEKKGDKQWITRGVYTWDDSTHSVKVTELPVGTWTKDYKAFLDTLVQGTTVESKEDGKVILRGFEDLYNDVDVNFTLFLEPSYYNTAKMNPEDFEKKFHLTTSWKTSNMCCFDNNMNIVKYNTVGDILEDFYVNRVVAYEKRKNHQIEQLKDQIEELSAKYVFVKAIVEQKLKIINAEDGELLLGLKSLKLPPRSDPSNPDTLHAYEYLLRMRVDKIKKSSVDDAEIDLAVAQQNLEELQAKTAAAIWRKELGEFEEAWNIAEKNILAVLSASTNTAQGGTKKKLVVRRKKTT